MSTAAEAATAEATTPVTQQDQGPTLPSELATDEGAAAALAQDEEAKPAVEDDGRRAVVFMHGLGDRGSSWADLAQMLGLASLPGVTWHFPDSPMQAVSVNSGAVMPSWFDIYEIPITESTPDDEASLIAATKSVLAYVDSLDVPREQVILGGFSQGGAMSLLTALESDRPFAGVIMLSGWAPMRNKLKQVFVRDSTAHAGTKVFHGHGTSDNVVLFKLAQASAAVMASEGMDVKFTGYPSMQHSSCQREMQDLSRWLAEILKGPTK